MIYYDNTAIEAVNAGRDTPDAFYNPKRPSELIAKAKWHATDAWRGYYKLEPEPGYKIIESDWTAGDWGDAISDMQGPDATEAKVKQAEAKHGTVYVIFTPTSNVFSTGMDILCRDAEHQSSRAERGKVVGHKTRRFDYPDGSWKVRYHATDVIAYNAKNGRYTLDTGGWNTITTAKRINDYLPSGCYVYRRNWIMYLHRPGRADVELKDGMEV